MPYGFGNPGGYLSQNQQFARMLGSMPDTNNGTVTGGIGSAITKTLMAYLMGRDATEQQDAQTVQGQAMQALTGSPESSIQFNGPRPDGTGDMTQAVPAVAPNRELAAQLLASNPRTAQLGNQIALGDAQYARDRTDKLSDVKDQRQYLTDAEQRREDFARSQTQSSQDFARGQTQSSQDFQRSMGTPMMVPDPNSSTGFRYVRPEQAVGQPAYNPNAPLGMGGGGRGADSAGMPTGDDFLKTISSQAAEQVKALAEGRMPFPGGMALKTPYWQQMITAVSQYDPNFDAVNYNARAATRKDFTSGKSAQNLTSFNTAIGHADSLDKSIDDLHNGNIPIVNAAQNSIALNAGDTRYQGARKAFEANKEALVSELTRAFRGSGGSASDVEAWSKAIDAADSPTALHAAVQKSMDLLNSRIGAVGDTYNRGMGTTKDPLELLSPAAQEAMARLRGGATPGQPPPAGASPTAPAQGVPEGATATNPQTGAKIVFRGGQWQPAQ